MCDCSQRHVGSPAVRRLTDDCPMADAGLWLQHSVCLNQTADAERLQDRTDQNSSQDHGSLQWTIILSPCGWPAEAVSSHLNFIT